MNNKNTLTNNPIITFRLNALEELLMVISSRLDELEEKLSALKLEMEESETTSDKLSPTSNTSSDTTILHLHDVSDGSL